jgi:hypothetical protein
MRMTIGDMERLKKSGKILGFQTGERSTIEKCIICGSEFVSYACYKKRGSNNGRFCSRDCANIFMAQKTTTRKAKLFIEIPPPMPTELLACKECGKPILEGGKIFCSRKCYSDNKKKTSGSLKIIQCLNCGKDFETSRGILNTGFGKFCSSSCSSIYRIKQSPEKNYGNSVGGKRQDLENRYFRSRWEANYARYLNFMIKQGQVLRWEYEIQTFYFTGIKRGTVSYTPDFKVYYPNGTDEFVEIKGYMDPRSKTKLNRMKRFYPKVKVVLFETKDYAALNRTFKKIIPFWETSRKFA